MDLEQLRRQSQSQLDEKLAEVDRLTGVVKELENKSAEAKKEHDELVDGLTSEINGLEAEKSFLEGEVSKVKNSLVNKQDELQITQKKVDEVKVECNDVVELISEKKRELEVVAQAGEKTVKSIETKVIAANKELSSIKTEQENVRQAAQVEATKLKQSIHTVQKKLDETEKKLTEKKQELTDIKNEEDSSLKSAKDAEYRTEEANKEIQALTATLRSLDEEVVIEEGELAFVNDEVEAVQAELKQLVAERIDSANYMKELEYKESNLRRKYEEVGLKYE